MQQVPADVNMVADSSLGILRLKFMVSRLIQMSEIARVVMEETKTTTVL